MLSQLGHLHNPKISCFNNPAVLVELNSVCYHTQICPGSIMQVLVPLEGSYLWSVVIWVCTNSFKWEPNNLSGVRYIYILQVNLVGNWLLCSISREKSSNLARSLKFVWHFFSGLTRIHKATSWCMCNFCMGSNPGLSRKNLSNRFKKSVQIRTHREGTLLSFGYFAHCPGSLSTLLDWVGSPLCRTFTISLDMLDIYLYIPIVHFCHVY